jgi:hypothetical protein
MEISKQMILEIIGPISVFIINIYLFKKGYEKGLKGVKISNKKYYLLVWLLTFYIRGYSKGIQEKLLNIQDQQIFKQKEENKND